MAISTENRNRLTLQIAPKEIYEASYPAWFLNETELLEKFKNDYEILLNFESNIDIVSEIPSVYKGYLFRHLWYFKFLRKIDKLGYKKSLILC